MTRIVLSYPEIITLVVATFLGGMVFGMIIKSYCV